MTDYKKQLSASLSKYFETKSEKQVTGDEAYISYGTAGFRGEATIIEHVFYKIGLISGLRSLKIGANVGVMVTASHNPVQDNGVKLIDSNGEMLELEWEPIVEKFCNLNNKNDILLELEKLVDRFHIDTSNKKKSRVLIGRDTRPSSEPLVALIRQGLDAWSSLVDYIDYGQVTTPALHYLVAESNKIQEITPDHYYKQLIHGTIDIFSRNANDNKTYCPADLVIDCANGVGFETLKRLLANSNFTNILPIKTINTGEGVLNHSCGADFVKTTHRLPVNANQLGKRYASLDGDADRVVYFYLDTSGGAELKLLDGDKIMSLYAVYLMDLLRKYNLGEKLSLGIVQTAYANGASTDYMKHNLGVNVEFTDTGVKNLHKKALDYDLGIYFEANGHGTIWVSDKARSLIMTAGDEMIELKQLLSILNNYTGDAISDILIVETILRYYDWDIETWSRLYQERPSSLIKVAISDRNCIKTTNAGRTCVEPPSLQPEIDKMVQVYGPESRCFVRASGTENVVRIYAEAKDQESSDELAQKVGHLVEETCRS